MNEPLPGAGKEDAEFRAPDNQSQTTPATPLNEPDEDFFSDPDEVIKPDEVILPPKIDKKDNVVEEKVEEIPEAKPLDLLALTPEDIQKAPTTELKSYLKLIDTQTDELTEKFIATPRTEKDRRREINDQIHELKVLQLDIEDRLEELETVETNKDLDGKINELVQKAMEAQGLTSETLANDPEAVLRAAAWIFLTDGDQKVPQSEEMRKPDVISRENQPLTSPEKTDNQEVLKGPFDGILKSLRERREKGKVAKASKNILKLLDIGKLDTADNKLYFFKNLEQILNTENLNAPEANDVLQILIASANSTFVAEISDPIIKGKSAELIAKAKDLNLGPQTLERLKAKVTKAESPKPASTQPLSATNSSPVANS